MRANLNLRSGILTLRTKIAMLIMGKITDHTEFNLKYTGDVTEIEANTFVRSLEGIIVAVEEVNKEIAKDRKIEIRVRAPERGSFLIHLTVDTQTIIETLKLYATLDNLYKVVVTVGGIIGIKKALGGKKPKKVEHIGNETNITIEPGHVIKVDARSYKIFMENARVNDALEGTFSALEADPNVSGLEIIGEKNEEIITSNREEFGNIATSTIEEHEKLQTENLRTTLNVLVVAFEGKYKWQFYHKGRKISAKISDGNFLKRIDAGEQFAKGDCLLVRLRIDREFDSEVNTFVDKFYEVIEVIKHIPRPEQGKLSL
jgi:hypothetical protein